ncbi:MAG: hypothetical protein ABS960_00475 [Solibacillus isronensis]
MKKKKSRFNKKSTRKAIKRLVKEGFSESEARVIINRWADSAAKELGGRA